MALVEATAKMCMTKTAKALCQIVVFNIFGPSKHYFDSLLYTVLNHIPAGASAKQFIHYFQIASTGKLIVESQKSQISSKLVDSSGKFVNFNGFLNNFRKIPTIPPWNR